MPKNWLKADTPPKIPNADDFILRQNRFLAATFYNTDMWDKIDQFLIRAFRLLDGLIVFGVGIVGTFITWEVLSSAEFATMAKVGYSAAAFFVAAFLGWIIWSVMKFLG